MRSTLKRDNNDFPALRGELDVIEFIRTRTKQKHLFSKKALTLGIGDDCAILSPRRGEDIVVTTDFCLEGRHFRRNWHGPHSIGHRTLARGLSDLAAMGARPLAAFLSLALPKELSRDAHWLGSFLDGMLSLAARFNVPLAGGDTSESPDSSVLADIVLLGSVPRGKALRRDGARVGDLLYVSGWLGGAAVQLEELSLSSNGLASSHPSIEDDSLQPHFFPEPRINLGKALLRRGKATAALDVSDGLSTDLAHLCRASDVCAEVELARIPLHPLLAGLEYTTALQKALHGGEDYELLFTASGHTEIKRHHKGVPIHRIGRIVSCVNGKAPITLIDPHGQRSSLQPSGWEHLR